MMLQINTAGAWKNVVAFEAAKEREVESAVHRLAGAVPDAKWCVVDDLGNRRWLSTPAKRTCRGCGCTQLAACRGGCHWVAADLCSRCEGR